VSAVGFLFWLAATFLSEFAHVFLPVAVAAVAALVFRPYYSVLERHLPTALALVAFFVSVLLPFVAFGWFFGSLIVEQVTDLINRLPELWQRFAAVVRERWPQVMEFFERHPLGQRLRGAVVGQADVLVGGLEFFGGKALSAGAGLLRGVGAVLNWVVTPVYLAFFLMADIRPARALESQLTFLREETRKDVVFLVREFVNIIVAFFRGQIVVAFLQGLLFAVGFSLVGLRYGLLLGLLLGFLNIVPYLGSIIGMSAALPLAYFHPTGGLGTLLGVIVVFAVVQLIEAYVLTPRIMGQRTGLHPMAIIFSVFFWGTAFHGILGMILAIPLTAFLVVFWRLAREKYIGELV
jgi:predicted PurR-regulated permease PerM